MLSVSPPLPPPQLPGVIVIIKQANPPTAAASYSPLGWNHAGRIYGRCSKICKVNKISESVANESLLELWIDLGMLFHIQLLVVSFYPLLCFWPTVFVVLYIIAVFLFSHSYACFFFRLRRSCFPCAPCRLFCFVVISSYFVVFFFALLHTEYVYIFIFSRSTWSLILTHSFFFSPSLLSLLRCGRTFSVHSIWENICMHTSIKYEIFSSTKINEMKLTWFTKQCCFFFAVNFFSVSAWLGKDCGCT